MSMEQRQADAAREGAAACRAGYLASECDYAAGTPQRADWLAGWRAENRRRHPAGVPE